MFLSKNPGIVFVHIYKNAGTSIRRSLLRAGIPDQTGDFGLPNHATASEIIAGIGQDEFIRGGEEPLGLAGFSLPIRSRKTESSPA